MRKVSKPFRKKNHKGWYIRWFVDGKQKTRCLPTKAIAEHYRHIKYQELNFDVFRQPIDLPYGDLKAEYKKRYVGKSEKTKESTDIFFINLEKFSEPAFAHNIDQEYCDNYIAYRVEQKLSPYTVNKDITSFRTLINWMAKKHYLHHDITLEKLPQPSLIRKALSDTKIRKLVKDCPNDDWRLKVLLSLTCDMRKSDIDNLEVSNIDLKNRRIHIKSTSTKQHGMIIIHKDLVNLVSKCLKNKDGRIFDNTNSRKIWDKFAGGITRQQLRVTFKTLMQTIGSISSVKQVLHKDLRVTKNYYTDEFLVLSWKINQLPVKKWLK